MGLLKKIFKPVSKVLDKIIPNEVKPFLPYAAAFAPYMLGPQSGIMGSGMLRRALMSGALNIGGQLAQEGNEGEINLLSAGLGALQGAMTSPGFSEKIDIMRGVHPSQEFEMLKGPPKFIDKGLEYLGKGSEVLSGMGETLRTNPLSVEGLKAATIPFTQGTGDLMYAQGQRDLKDLANDVVEDMGGGYSDDAYRAAIRKSMTAYGATEEEIIDAIEAAGYRSGGRVGFRDAGLAGLMNPQQSMDKEENQWISRASPTKEIDTINRIYEEGGNEGLQAYLERNPDLKDKYVIVADSMSGELSVMPNKLHPDNIDMEKIITIDTGQGGVIDLSSMLEEKKAKGGRITPKRGLVDGPGGYAGEVEFGGITEAVENVDGKEKEKITEAYDSESDMSQWKIGNYRPFKYTGAIDDMWKMNLDEGSPLEYIFKIGMTVRAPLIDVIRGAGKTAAETAKLIAAAGELGWDLTKPAREILSDVGSAGLEGTKWALGQSDKWRYGQPLYWMTRAAGNMSDDEARLSMQEGKVGDFRKDKDLIKKLETKLFKDKTGYGSDYQGGEVELYPGQQEKYATGGVASVLPKGIEADYRGGGFIPIGSKERADDVPARLSENEFVMTADAVRAAGGGSVNKGAKRMYNLMHNLEARA